MVFFIIGLPTELVDNILAGLSTSDLGSTLSTCKLPGVARGHLWRAHARRLWGIELPPASRAAPTTEDGYDDGHDDNAYFDGDDDAAATVFCRVALEKSSRDAFRALSTCRRKQQRLDDEVEDKREDERKQGWFNGEPEFDDESNEVKNLAEMRASALARVVRVVESGLAQAGFSSANAANCILRTWKSGLDFLDCLEHSESRKRDRYSYYTKDESKLCVFAISSRESGRLTTFHHHKDWWDCNEQSGFSERNYITARLVTNTTRALIFAGINNNDTKGGMFREEEEEEESRLTRVAAYLCKEKCHWFMPIPPEHCEELLRLLETSRGYGRVQDPPPPPPSELARLFAALELDPAVVTPEDLLLAILLTFDMTTPEEFLVKRREQGGGAWQVPRCLVHTSDSEGSEEDW